MHEKWRKNTIDGLHKGLDYLETKVSRREMAIGTGAFLAGAALTLVATEAVRDDAGEAEVDSEADLDNLDALHAAEIEHGVKFTTGIDISHPQGSAEHLAHMRKDYVIVGVNGGVPTTANAYLADQLRVASIITQNADVAQTGMLPIQLYLNTANPADYYDNDELVRDWPIGEDASIPHNPYALKAACDGTDTQACMYVYGWQRAKESVEVMFAQAALEAGVSTNPVDYTWWLDVEEENSWRKQPRHDETPQKSNRAVLEGMVAYLHSFGAGVGLYSASSHWSEIMGDDIDASSSLYTLPSWVATGLGPEEPVVEMLTGEREKPKPFTRGSEVAIIQRVEGKSVFDPDALDYNYAIAKPLGR